MCGGVTGDILSGAGNIASVAAAPASVFVGGAGTGVLSGIGEGGAAASAAAAGMPSFGEALNIATAGPVAAEASAAGAAAAGAGAAGYLSTIKNVATVLSPISSVISAASGIRASRAMAKTAAPGVPAPVTMPIFGSGQTFKSMRDQADVAATRRGRAATILTAPTGEKLGAS